MEARQLLAGDLIAHWNPDSLNTAVEDGAAISEWQDSIGGATATATGTPVLVKGAFSGHSVVNFNAADGTDLFLIDRNVNPLSRAADFSVAVAFRTDSSQLVGGNGNWYENTGLVDSNRQNFDRGWGLSLNQAGQVSGGMGAGFVEPVTSVYSHEAGLNDGQLHLATLTRSGSTLSVYIDDGPASTITNADDGPRANTELVFGALQWDKGNPFTGSIAEVRIYNGQLSSAEVSALYQQLDSYYDNEAPTAVDDEYYFNEDPNALGFVSVSAAEGLLANDSDPEGNPLTPVLVTEPEFGRLILNKNGSFNYLMPKDFFGTETFTYTANDAQPSNLATVTFHVANTYDPATAVNDTYKLLPTEVLNLSADLGVLANDLNPDRVTLEAVLDTDVNQGQLNLAQDGSLSFDPQGQPGYVTFTYRVNDQTQLSSTATVTFIVNTPPVAADDEFTVTEDVPFIRTADNGVRANDMDADGNVMTVTLIDNVQHGVLTLNGDGSFEYVPDQEFSGEDGFTYRLNDGEDDSSVATVQLMVQAVNDLPVAAEDAYFTNTDEVLETSADLGVLANDSDVDNLILTASLVQAPQHGTLELALDGSFKYTPAAGYRGTDSFTYRAHDDQAQTDPVTVTLVVGETPLVISEFMAANGTTLETRLRTDPNNNFRGERSTPDWIELHNLIDVDLNITGYHLTDGANNPLKWAFPAGTIVPASGYLVVFADRLNVLDPNLDELGLLHTNFKLDVAGEYTAVASPTGVVLDAYDTYPEQRGDISYGRTPNGSVGYLLTASPGEANADAYMGLVPETTISVPRGFYDKSFSVSITNPDLTATIRYTIDGAEPTLDIGQDFSGPITIDGTTVLKAVAFRDGYIPSPVTAQSYLFLDQVLQRDNTPPEGAIRWGHNVKLQGDYEMDPEIVNNADPELRPVVEDFLRLPTVSLSIDNDLFFGERDGKRGIYIIGQNDERPVSFEYMDPANPGASLQTNSTIQIVGGSSPDRWKSDKLSLRVRFTETEGASELDYPVFGPDAATTFDTLVLDARLNNVWHYGNNDYQRSIAQYTRDEYAAELQRILGGLGTHDQYVHVYINGIYWGMHAMHERPDDNFNASYQGGVAEDYNVIKHDANTIVSGSNESFKELLNVLGRRNDPPLTDEAYAAATELLDQDDFINYMLVNYYGGNEDWDHHNWYASQNPFDGKWRFHSWDAEKILQSVFANSAATVNPNSPTGIQNRLMTHPEYQLRFADHVQQHFFHEGALTPEAAASVYLARTEKINLVTRLESARWGDNRIDQGAKVRYTRQHWLDNRAGLLNDYFPERTGRVVGQFEKLNWFLSGQAPEFSIDGSPQYGGSVTPGSLLTMSAPEGTIYYSTNGLDPRRTGGAVAPQAHVYSQAISLDASLHVMARMRRTDGSWGPLSVADFSTAVDADASNLRITEIHYHPAGIPDDALAAGFTDADEFEFIELKNISDRAIDLSEVRFVQTPQGSNLEGVAFAFGDGSVRELLPGGRVVVVENIDAFTLLYGNQLAVAGQWDGGLSNASERLVLMAGDTTIADFSYDDGWHTATDGKGPSLQAVDEAGDPAKWGTAAYWRASQYNSGSPGRVESPLPGDSNYDGLFDSQDMLKVLAAGKYEDGLPGGATFAEGDWDGDGAFTSDDLIYVLAQANYLGGSNSPTSSPVGAVAASLFAASDRSSPTATRAAEESSPSDSELDALYAELSQEDGLI